MSNINNSTLNIQNTWDFIDQVDNTNNPTPGLSKALVETISKNNKEPNWMLELRLKALDIFYEKKMPSYGPDLSKLDLDSIYYYAKPAGLTNTTSWDEVPENIKNTFDKLWIPEAEKHALAGVWAQYDSDAVYHSLEKELSEQWVIFEDMTHALQNPKYEKIIKEYFSKSIPVSDHKFSALHYAVWNWWTFLYVPEWVKIIKPLQSYFRMNLREWWQFEHTIIILEKDAEAHYIEGCSAPKYDKNSLHAGWVEIFVWVNAQARYSSVENWSLDTYNLNTKRAILQENAHIDWVSGNMWSNTTMLYPCSILLWDKSSCDHLWVSFANTSQNQDIGSKVIHIGKNTSSNIVSKTLSKWWWISTYRWLVKIGKNATWSISKVDCDGLMLDNDSVSNAIPDIIVENTTSIVAHEASAWKINQKDLFYLMSRWISEEQATSIIVNGFISPILKELPLEYASEMNVLVSMEFEGH